MILLYYNRNMSKKRPGVEAGVNLVSLDDVRTWEKIEKHCKEVIQSIPNLRQYEAALKQLGPSKESFDKADLDQIVLWKHTVGKNRIYNIKYLNANTDDNIKDHSRAAITVAKNIDLKECLENDGSLSQAGRAAIQEALGELGKLKGVGPATASAILTLVRPDVFCYLYDEVIDCFEPQRDYKISNYLRVNSRCLQLAKNLGGDWTTSRVAKTIWTAARFLAINGKDLTKEIRNPMTGKTAKKARKADSNGDDEEDEDEDNDADEDDDFDDVSDSFFRLRRLTEFRRVQSRMLPKALRAVRAGRPSSSHPNIFYVL